MSLWIVVDVEVWGIYKNRLDVFIVRNVTQDSDLCWCIAFTHGSKYHIHFCTKPSNDVLIS